MFGVKAVELIKEYQRTRDNLKPINDDGIRQVIQESKVLYEENQNDVALVMNSNANYHAAIQLRHKIILHNKRCLLAYMYNRVTDLRDLRWSFGSVLPPDLKECLSEPEINWFNNYNKCLAKYMSSIGTDLMQNTCPPKSLCIQVRCLVDYGELTLDDGTSVTLTKNTTHLLKRTQCEKLIRLGILEHII